MFERRTAFDAAIRVGEGLGTRMTNVEGGNARELTFADYLDVVRRRWKIVVGTTVATVLLALGYSISQTEVYESSAQVLIRTNTNDQLFPSIPSSERNRLNRNALSELDFVASDRFASALAEAGAESTVTAELPETSTGGSTRTSNVLIISARGATAEVVALDASTAAELYVRTRHEQDLTEHQRRVEISEDQLATVEAETVAMLAPVAAYDDLIDAEEDADLRADLIDERSRLEREIRSELVRLDTERIAAENRLRSLEESSEAYAEVEVAARILADADVPGSPVLPNTSRNVLVALIVGLLLGLAAAWIRDLRDDRIHEESDVERLGLNVLASVPVSDDPGGPSRQGLAGPDAERLSDAHRRARAALVFGAQHELQRILVTSAAPGEGKTTVCVNLGFELAQTGQRTLVIDGDLHAPRLHRRFAISNERGLTSVLAGTVSPDDAVVNIPGTSLFVLPAGPAVLNPAELIASAAFQALLESAREEFDITLIDSPPLLAVSDASLFGPSVDAAIISVSAGIGGTKATRRRDLTRVLRLLDDVNVPVVGSILHGVRMPEVPYAYSTDARAEAEGAQSGAVVQPVAHASFGDRVGSNGDGGAE